MGIRKKIFYITAAVMLSVLLVSYGVMYQMCIRDRYAPA